jgi:hypothetical protein
VEFEIDGKLKIPHYFNSVTLDKSLKDYGRKCENQGEPGKIFNRIGLTKFTQICIWLKASQSLLF